MPYNFNFDQNFELEITLVNKEATTVHHIICVYIKGCSGFILLLRRLIQRIKAWNALYVVYVDTVETKDQGM